jgi:uncharacterized membrane protein YeaQ/YmgE (transglycosylase-associated protein family)
MSATIINLIIQLIAGAVGGNAAGATMKNLNLGALGNTIAGALAARAADRFSLHFCRSSRGRAATSMLARCLVKWSAAASPALSLPPLSVSSKI